MRKSLFVCFVLISFLLPQTAIAVPVYDESLKTTVTITEAEKKMAEAITAKQLKEYLTYIASDERGGRDTPSKGLDEAAQYIADHLKEWGFKPAGDDGTFFQKMNIVRQNVTNPEFKIGDKAFAYGDDFVRVSGDGFEEAPLVYARDGWMVKSKGIDAYEGIDVKDKIVVLYSSKKARSLSPSMPDGVTDEDLKGEKGVDWNDPAGYAEMKGAKGIILVMNPAIEQRWAMIRRFFSGGGSSVEGLGGGGSVPGAPEIPSVLVNSKVAKALFEGASADLDAKSSFEIGKNAGVKMVMEVEKTPTQNVVALWEGSDPVLKNEMVAIGAHYDHVGTNESTPGEDKIWNGADDDGSGTVGVLAVAEALHLAPQRPRRSVLFVWHAGEEKGLWGSEYFNKYPTVDIKKVVAQLNIDMIGRSKAEGDKNPKNNELTGPNEVYVIGSEMMSSTLGQVTKETNSAYMGMNYNYKYDDPNDKNRFFFRSDHFNYAVNGIPVVFWFTGVHEDYHGPNDEVDKIDFEKMESISRTIFLTLWELSELNERPAVDKKLPPGLSKRN